MRNVTFYTWKLEANQLSLIDNIHLTLEKLIGEDINKSIIELASYGDWVHKDGWGVLFGQCRGVSDPNNMTIMLPALELLNPIADNEKYRKDAYDTLKAFVFSINNNIESLAESTKVCAVSKEGYTIGKSDTDFQISDIEIEYAKKIRDLLGGCTIRITKGDMKIEIT